MTSEVRERWAPAVAAGGFVLGLLLWAVAVDAIAAARVGDVPEAVLRARERGLVSFTVVNGYDKSQETLAWLLGCLVVPSTTWVAWALMHGSMTPAFRVGRRRTGRRRAEDAEGADLDEADDDSEDGERRTGHLDRRGPPPWVPWAGLGATLAAVALRPGFLRGPSPWGSFGLLGEEGVYLGAIQAMRTGRVLYTDLEFPYGPLAILPLDLWMRIFGDTVVVARLWVLLLHLAGLAGAAVAVRWMLGPKTGPWAGLGAAIALAVYAPLFLPNLNGVLLRPVLAVLPGAALFAAGRAAWFARRDAAAAARAADGEGAAEGGHGHGRRRSRLADVPRPWREPMVGVGVLAAVAALFSFELGPAAAAGLLAAGWVVRPSWRDVVWIAGGATFVGVVVGLPLATSGALEGLPVQMERMLTLPALGYQALPYPDVLGLFRDGAGATGTYAPEDPATTLWALAPPLAIWGGLSAGVCGPRRGDVPTRFGAVLIVAVAAAVLYRAALGRSDLYHLWFYGAAPVALIATLLLAVVWDLLRPEWRPAVPAAGALLAVAFVSVGSEPRVRFPDAEERRLAEAAGVDDPLVAVPVRLPRTGHLRLLPRLATQIEAIVGRAAELPPGDGVWFYPSEATYAFLTGRPMPQRFLWAYDAATPALQDAAIAELERTRPRWVFRSSDTFPIDHIPQSRLVPRLDSYLLANYRPVEVLPGATLMERIE